MTSSLENVIKDHVEEATALGYKVCVLDTNNLFEDSWQDFLHEVWAIIAPTNEVSIYLYDSFKHISASTYGQYVA